MSCLCASMRDSFLSFSFRFGCIPAKTRNPRFFRFCLHIENYVAESIRWPGPVNSVILLIAVPRPALRGDNRQSATLKPSLEGRPPRIYD
jgi:hypothetical protein